MTRPRRFLTRMIVFLAMVLIVIGALFAGIRTIFAANPALNALIFAVIAFGIAFIFRQVVMLYPEVDWIESFRRDRVALSGKPGPRLLGPMATMLGDRSDRLRLSATSQRSLLDSISSRLDESCEISRYLINLLIFLGLLGTFWGLLQTVGSVGGVIGTLDVSSNDLTTVFDNLKKGLEAPLAGMGTAFSSSLFGLSGSLVLGFLELQAGQAQNRFYNELEEWLSSVTRLSSGGAVVEGDQAVPAYIQALLEQTADSLENLQRTLARGQDNQVAANTALVSLSERLSTLTDQMRAEQSLMIKLAESQLELKPVLNKLATAAGGDGGMGMDSTTRTHIRNIEVYLARMLEDAATGRSQLIQELRSEIKLLARTIAAVAEEDGR
ncbi:MAG: flagellar motor protein MotA [Alphaproteobacteria bacterium]